MDNTNRIIISRRTRPAKDALSREIIVKTAFELLAAEGLSGMSMRKIAKHLDTGASSLYVYVKNIQELYSYVVDYGLRDVILPEGRPNSWKSELVSLLNSYLNVLYTSPGVAELALTTIPIGPYSLAINEYILARLQAGGAQAKSAAWGADMLLLYVTSVAFEQSSREQKGMTLQSIRDSYQSLDAVKYPMLVRLNEEMFSGDEERFQWGLEVILQGILHNPK
ncbi:TetR family transcriptional regulator [Paenibacillus sp. CFBP13512]|uniref:TetR/AcrR family transcriptional regulator n=1 Tax=Paenibacillus TaxID=44249 RepID=UPI0010BFC042|nr:MULTISPECIES: TetR/AcrR family transcriptional regulator [Paenibacillus]TKJ92826.1 TetR family transcriptional regulator [Paenibacillus sp. CFBP13512]CAJ1314905.1 HTH tetR-type domain-containing protein [Paenibacillus nuruki]